MRPYASTTGQTVPGQPRDQRRFISRQRDTVQIEKCNKCKLN
jgi:hypothetical protein